MIMMFQIILNKAITRFMKLFGYDATVFPGSITYNINQKILGKIKYPKHVIGITGSSGKGTVLNLVAHSLIQNGYDVCYNKDSNGIRAITTLILNNCTIFGKFKHDILLLEIDEKHLHLVFTKNKMSHLVITNITRDQPTRHSSSDFVYRSIFNTLDNQTTLFINADDPGLKQCETHYTGKIITFGLARTKDSYLKSDMRHIDHVYCPVCKRKLSYYFYHYGHFGDYTCKYCNFQRGTLNYEGTNVDLEHKTMKIENNVVHLSNDFLYIAYEYTAAYALLKTLGLNVSQIINSFNTPFEFSRTADFTLDHRKCTFIESKNENNLSYYQSLKYIAKKKEIKTVIIGFEVISKRYKMSDLSWIWDIEFELLHQDNIDAIICVGSFKYDLANRLEYAGIPTKKIHILEENDNYADYIKENTKGNIYTMLNYQMKSKLQKEIRGADYGDN